MVKFMGAGFTFSAFLCLWLLAELAVPTSPVPTNDALVQTARYFGGARGGRVSGVLATAGASRRCRR